MATVQMIKGDRFADIFDSPETIAQARRDGYSLVEAEDIKRSGLPIDELSKKELVELAKEKGVYEKGMERLNKPDLIDRLNAADSAGTEPEGESEQETTPEQGPGEPEAGKKNRGFFG
ncbi:MAG: hypothetical protein LBU16_09780 [Treponema sp.]|jgi:hypothetical protein|nr:hypothetical protein [Treponema sp.]